MNGGHRNACPLQPLGELHPIEDDSELRPLLLGLLRRSGFRASGARNGVEMQQALRSASVDLVVLDVMLPGRSGYDLCRELRATCSVPIILLTALADASDRVIGLELGQTISS